MCKIFQKFTIFFENLIIFSLVFFAFSTLGRYKESKLSHLIGEEPNEQIDGQVVEETIRQVEMAPINRQPFSSHV